MDQSPIARWTRKRDSVRPMIEYRSVKVRETWNQSIYLRLYGYDSSPF